MNKSLKQLVEKLREEDIQPMDAIRVKEKTTNLIRAALTHYAIFSHWDADFPVFVANYLGGGVREIPFDELLGFTQTMSLSSIRRFSGNESDRMAAKMRMEECFGKAPYDWKDNNCETFANYVQTGKAYSQQSYIVAGTVISIGAGALTHILVKGRKALGAIIILALIVIAFIAFQIKRSDGQVSTIKPTY